MASAPSHQQLGKLAVERGLLTKSQLGEAVGEYNVRRAAGSRLPFGEVLVELDLITRPQLEGLLQEQGGKPSPKQVIPGFELLKKLGEGGMGATYLARQVSMDRMVALKVLRKNFSRNQDYVARFRREAKLAGQLEHANIVQTRDVGEGGGFHYLIMEYVEGRSLRQLMPEGAVEEGAALRVVLQVARALEHAHAHNIVHRDVKPDNILLTCDHTAKLCDFGLAKSVSTQTHLTQSGMTVGTPHYVSPEQARGSGRVDIRADIYSLGATLYHLVTGETPFHGSSAAVVMTKHLSEQVPWPQDVNPRVSDRVCRLIEKMMAKDPGDRYATPAELIADLELVLEGQDPLSNLDPGRSSIARSGAIQVKRVPRRRRAGRLRDTRRALGPVGEFVDEAPTISTTPLAAVRRFASVPVVIGAAVLFLAMIGGGIWIASNLRGRDGDDGKSTQRPPAELEAESAWNALREKHGSQPKRENAAQVLADLATYKGHHGDTEFGRSRAELIGELKAAAVRALTEEPAANDGEEMLKYAEEYWKKNPGDYQGAKKKFRTVLDAGKGVWSMQAEDAIRDIDAARARDVKEARASAEGKARALVAAGDYDAALSLLEARPARFADEIAADLKRRAGLYREQVESKLGALISAAEKSLAAREYDAGLVAVARAEGIKYSPLRAKVAGLRGRLQQARMAVVRTQSGKLKAAAEKLMDEALHRAADLVAEGKGALLGAHLKEVTKCLGPEGLRFVHERMAAAERVAGLLSAHQASRPVELAKTAGREVSLNMRNGSTHNVKILKVLEKHFEVERRYTLMGQARKMTYRISFADLRRGEIDSLLPPFKPEDSDGQITAALMALGRRRWKAAEAALKAAGDHVLAPTYRRKLQVARLGAAEVEAREAWLAEVEARKREKLDFKSAEALLAALDAFAAKHAETKFGKGKLAELASLRKLAKDAVEASPMGQTAKVRKLFRGKLVSFDPKTLAVELLWDFSDEKQLEDFEILAGDWKIAEGKLVGEANKWGTGQRARPRALFAPKCKASVSAAVRQGRLATLQLGRGPCWVTACLNFLAYKDAPNPRVWMCKGISLFSKNGLVSHKVPILKLGSAYQMEIEMADFAASARFEGKKLGTVRGIPCKAVQVALGVYRSAEPPTVSEFDSLRVTGKFDAKWLDSSLKAAAAKPKPASVFVASWRQLKIFGDRPAGRTGIKSSMAYDSKRKWCVLYGGYYNNSLWVLDLARMRWFCMVKNNLGAAGPARPGASTNARLTYDAGGDLYRIFYGWAYSPVGRRWSKQDRTKNGGINPTGNCGWAYDCDTKSYMLCKGAGALGLHTTIVNPKDNTSRGLMHGALPGLDFFCKSIVYDRRNKVFVLFSGSDTVNDTWTFDPARAEWRKMRPPLSPLARRNHTLLWNDKVGVVVLHGGAPGNWVYETAADRWTEIRTAVSPPHQVAAVAYDQERDAVVLFNKSAQTWLLKIARSR
jgi:serine/threonine-protein kinase